MVDVRLPTYVELMLPTLEAIEKLGGSGTRDEIDEAASQIMGLGVDQLAVEFAPEARQKGSKVVHRLAWARSYLKKFGAVNNSDRGVWTLEERGRQFLGMDKEIAVATLRSADAEARRELRQRRHPDKQPTQPEFQKIRGDDDLNDATESETSQRGTESSDWKSFLLKRLMDLSPAAFGGRAAGGRGPELRGAPDVRSLIRWVPPAPPVRLCGFGSRVAWRSWS